MFEHQVVLRAGIQLLVEFTIVVVVSGNHAAFLDHQSEMVHLLAAFLDLIGGLGHESTGTDHVLQPQLGCELDTLGAWLLAKMSRRATSAGHRADIVGIADNYAGLIDEVRQVNR